jgi:hypothetical protein
MINSAKEFHLLRTSSVKEEYDRAAHDSATIDVWLDVIREYPELRKWVEHNKTIPIEIIKTLINFDSDVRSFVAAKRNLTPELFDLLSKDSDYIVRQALAANKKNI